VAVTEQHEVLQSAELNRVYNVNVLQKQNSLQYLRALGGARMITSVLRCKDTLAMLQQWIENHTGEEVQQQPRR